MIAFSVPFFGPIIFLIILLIIHASLGTENLPKKQPKTTFSPRECYHNAKKLGKGRYLQGEYVIARNAEYSYKYARDVLKGRFKDGEWAISQSGKFSYLYAMLLKKRFRRGEKKLHKIPLLPIITQRLSLRIMIIFFTRELTAK